MFRNIRVRVAAVSTVAMFLLSLAISASAQISFSSNGLPGVGLSDPTSLDFGPDNRLYVSQRYGQIKVYTLVRNAPGDYAVTSTETINLIQQDVENHDDDGSACSNDCNRREVTGLMTAGTAANPVLYVTSSDPRVAVGTDSNLDTNSGVISRLTCSGGISGNACAAWDHVDIVRGLPRSEENHATNGMDLDEATNTLYVMSGGHANQGAPGNNFSGTPEYYLSASMLKVDLDAIEAMETNNGGPFTDSRTNTQFVYDLVTLDDPSRANIDNSSPDFPYASGHPYYNLEIDPGDPFGGNNSLNQAIPVPGGPVQIHSPGYRNAFDVVVTEAGEIYTWDNGPNGGWGGLPVLFDNTDTQKGDQSTYDPGAGDYCTNDFNLNNGSGHGDVLHNATADGYYGGHPAPIRAFPDKAGIVNFTNSGSGWVQTGPVYNFKDRIPTGYGVSGSDFADESEQCDYQADDPYNGGTGKYLEKVSHSTNGIAEYTATNFSGALQGNLLAAAFNGNIYRCEPDGAGGLVNLSGSTSGLSTGDCEVLFSGFGSQPLDVIAQADGDIYPGTVWSVTYGANNITIFEPTDFGVCEPTDPLEDSDNDGYTNGDEADNLTDPCSGGSQPNDWDNDGISDLNDADDDQDGIPDVDDPFALDATNGLGTPIPTQFPFSTENPVPGLFEIGFTGLMLDVGGSATWLDLFDPEKLAAGGATGQMLVEEVTTGDAHKNTNTQENGFLVGVNADVNSPPFVVHSRVLTPYFQIGGSASTPDNFQSFGIFIGTGDQNNYLKIVVASNSGNGGIEVGKETGTTGNTTFTANMYSNSAWGGAPILASSQVDLYLEVDPQALTVQPRVSFDQGTNMVTLGSPISIPAAWLDANDNQGFAAGLISTANGADEFGATWDFLDIDLAAVTATGAWTEVNDTFNETRHEGGFVQAGDKFYVMGGRESDAVRIYDPATDAWSTGATSPIKLHHFQAVEFDGLIYVIGAMTGNCCTEPEAPNVYIYDPVADNWMTGPAMPAGRERGGAGAALHNGKIYLVSGNTNGHTGPVSAAVDMFDPATGTFTPMADIPNPRDHFFVTVAGDFLYAVGGRESGTDGIFNETIEEVDVLDLTTGTWSTLPAGSNLPTPRAAAPTGLIGNEIIIAGGESGVQSAAHEETEALDLSTLTWRTLTNMTTERHATQAIVSNNGFYVAAGSPSQGGPGGAQLNMEALYLFGETDPTDDTISAGLLGAPNSVDFGDVQTGSSSTKVATLTNSGGNQGIVIESVALQTGTLFELGSAWVGPVVLAPGASLNVVLEFTPGAVGAETDTLEITHSGGVLETVDLQASGVGQPTALYRINTGGPTLAATDSGPDWASDTVAAPSPYFVPGACGTTECKAGNYGAFSTKDHAVPGYVPDALFVTERWDPATGAPMQWEFPVTSGSDYMVRLYFKNGYTGTDAAGDRQFTVTIEGNSPAALTNIDPSGTWGHQGAGMLEHQLTAGDGTLNIDFSHVVENPLVNGIEIMEIGAGGNVPPAITPFNNQSSVEGDSISTTVYVTDTDGPSNVEFSATGLPPGLSFLDQTNGHLGGVIDAGAAANSPYEVTITADDGADTSQITFSWYVSGPGADIILYRVNNGGPQLAATDAGAPSWSADQSIAGSGAGGTAVIGTPSAYVNVPASGDKTYGTADSIDLSHASLSSSAAPEALFQLERWDPSDPAPEMQWDFPVDAGKQIEIRIYLAEVYLTANGGRVFDIAVDGAVPAEFDDVDIHAIAGSDDKGIRLTYVTTSDGNVNLELVHITDNPSIKGIEIVELGVAANAAPLIDTVADQFVVEDTTESISFNVIDAEADATTISIVSVPDASAFVSPNIVTNAVGDYTVELDFTPLAGDAGSYQFTVTADDGTSQPTEQFTLSVTEGGSVVLYRINVGGPQVAAADASAPDWSIDNATTASVYRTAGGTNLFNDTSGIAYTGPVVMTHPSIPASAPASIFQFERYDAAAAPTMDWSFPVPSGAHIELRLFFAELYNGITTSGQRVFSVNVEGAVPAEFADIDAFGTAGAKGASMKSIVLTMADNSLDIEFLNNIENPALKGIEIIQIDPADNSAPAVTNPGDQANLEGDNVSLQVVASDADLHNLTYSASNLPPDLMIDPTTGLITGVISDGGDGAFVESGGLVVIEMESAETIPSDWAEETVFASHTGDGYLRYAGANSLSNPDVDTLTYPVEITSTGIYRFQWRNAYGLGNNGSEHNDSWLKIEADSPSASYAFYGEKTPTEIVCPKGYNPAVNSCTPQGAAIAGAGSDGWFKIYRSGGNMGAWSWTTKTSDNDAHDIFARFDTPGTYYIKVSARSAEHAIDRMVLWKTGAVDPLDTSTAQSIQDGAGAADGSPYASQVTVTDGVTPVTVDFVWTVGEVVQFDEPRAQVSITPAGSLIASTYDNGSIVIENTSTDGQKIESVTINLASAVLPDIVWDPEGHAGDELGKCLTPNTTTGNPGYVTPTNACIDPFSQPHNGVDELGGFDVITLNFTDFDPGDTFSFSIDVDPTSIKDAQQTGDAGSVSGVEVSGAEVTVTFDDTSVLTGEVFRIPGAPGGGIADVRPTAIATPAISVTGVTLNATTLSAKHTAAVVPSVDTAQTILVTGPAGASVRLLQMESALLASYGFELELFEANEALVLYEYAAVIEPDGDVEIPVTLTRTNAIFGGYNYFNAVIEDNGRTGPNSNFVVLELDSGIPNQAPVAGNDLASVDPGLSVVIDLTANDSDNDGTLDFGSITIVDTPVFGTLAAGALGTYTYTHDGLSVGNDSFTYTINDNDAATSNVATVTINVVNAPDVPPDVDGDEIPNGTDNDDDNDLYLDTEDPFALDADNGLTTDLPVSLPLFTADPGTGLFGLGFTGLMTNGVIGGAQGDDYQSLYDVARVLVDDNPANGGVLTLAQVDGGDALNGVNTQTHAFQLGLNIDDNSQSFVVHSRILAPWFDDVSTPQDDLSLGMFIGTGDQDNYLKMVLDGANDEILLLLEDAGTSTEQSAGGPLLGSAEMDLFLIIDPLNGTAQGQVSIDGGAVTNVGTPVNLPATWLDDQDMFGLAMGLIATSSGPGPAFDAHFDLLEAYFLAADEVYAAVEDDATTALDVLDNDHANPELFILSVDAPDNGGSAVINDNNTPLLTSDDFIDYTPAADFAGVETFTYTVEDGNGVTGTAIVLIDVAPINDAPIAIVNGNLSIDEDAGAQAEAAFATFFSGGGADEAGQSNLGFLVSNDNNALFDVQPAIDAAGQLTYTTVANLSGVANVEVFAQDDGGIANGGVDVSVAASFTITVAAVNDAPSITLLGDQLVNEDAGVQLLAAFATNFAPGGGLDEAGQGIAGFIVSNDNNALFAVQPDVGIDGSLSYTPADHASGQATVSVQVQDDGGTASGGTDVSAVQTFLITVAEVNDPPPPPSVGSNPTVDEDSGAQMVAAFVGPFLPGDGENGQGLLDYPTSNDNNALFSVQPDIDNNGNLSYTPAANASGVATVNVQAQDDGGTANGGSDISVAASFTITVTPINDAPSVSIGPNQLVIEDAGPQTVAGFAFDFQPGGGVDESSQMVADYLVVPDNAALFSVLPDIANDGTLVYTTAENAHGVATVSVLVQDDGGTANSGNDTSSIQMFTITITEESDVPAITAFVAHMIDEDSSTGVVPFTISDADTDLDTLIITADSSDTALVPVANIVLGGSGANRTIEVTPAADANGSTLITVMVDDGTDVISGSFNLTVTPVQDAPDFVLAGDQAVDEDAGPQSVAGVASGFTPGGGIDEAGQVVLSYMVSNDNPGLFTTTPAIDASGTLTYETSPDANGVAEVEVQVQDDGGTANGGADTSAVQTLQITVNVVDDAPTIDLGGDQTVDQDAEAQSVAGFASNFQPGGGMDEASQVIDDMLVSNDNNALFAVQPDIDNSGTLIYTPAAGESGSAVVTIQVRDTGVLDNGGENTSTEQFFTITVDAEEIPPTVASIDTVAGTGDGVLLDGEATNATFTQLLVNFDEDVSTGGGTNVANYKFFATGVNGLLETATCAGPIGDDVELTIDTVTWLAASNTAALAINNGVGLAKGRYRLAVCDSITDANGTALDGNGDDTAGGDFSISFSARRTTLLSNPNLDNNLHGWLADEFGFSAEDADGHVTSGSALWTGSNSSSGMGVMTQCVELDQPGSYSAEGLVRIGSALDTAALDIMVNTYDGADCNGTTLSDDLLPGMIGDTGGDWTPFKANGTTPAGAVSMSITMIATADNADTATVEVDNLYANESDVLFSHSFED